MRVLHMAFIALAPIALAACSDEAENAEGAQAADQSQSQSEASGPDAGQMMADDAGSGDWGQTEDTGEAEEQARGELGDDGFDEGSDEPEEFADEAEFEVPPPPLEIEEDGDFE